MVKGLEGWKGKGVDGSELSDQSDRRELSDWSDRRDGETLQKLLEKY